MARLSTILIIIFGSLSPAGSVSAQFFPFSWDRATIYTVSTDLFLNADPSNDVGSGSSASGGMGTPSQGGDFAGITAKISEGYFASLGINSLCLSDIFPRSYSGDPFDSIWAVDYVAPSTSLGGVADFKRLVEAAHGADLRIVLNVTLPMNSVELGLDSLSSSRHPTIDELMIQRFGEAGISQAETLRDYFARSGYPPRSDFAAINWLANWVRQLGIDGFRVAEASRLEPSVLKALKAEGVSALAAWKSENPMQTPDGQDFWLLAELDGPNDAMPTAVEMGIDAVTNVDFSGSAEGLDDVFSTYSAVLAADPQFNAVSDWGSAPRTSGNPVDPISAGTNLFLLPGGIQLFSGDELASTLSDNPGTTGALLDWDTLDESTFDHWSRLGQFRARHPAIAAGGHEKISDEPYAFYRGVRIGQDVDEVIVILGASGRVQINVRKYFPDDTILRDAYTGKISMVSFGEASFESDANGVLLLEPVN